MDDDRAIYRKLVYRAAEEFFCRDCLAEQFGCAREKIDRLIAYYRESGECTLFR
jgi:biotin operon repressor